MDMLCLFVCFFPFFHGCKMSKAFNFLLHHGFSDSINILMKSKAHVGPELSKGKGQ